MSKINYVLGDATQPEGPRPLIIAHIVNDRGGWGAGFSGALSRRWPMAEQRYREWASRGLDSYARFYVGNVWYQPVGGVLVVAA